MDKGSSITFGVLMGLTIVSGIVLSSSTASADDPESTNGSANASVTVSAACTLSSTSTGSYTAEINNGSSSEINASTISAVCNDPNGYSLYAIGNSNDSLTNNNDKLISSISNDYNIPTGTSTSGGTSNWAMKVNPTTGNNPTITNSFNNYHNVPTTYTQVATYNSATTTSSSTGASVDTKYQVYISGSQPAGTYTGKVKYTLVHPNNGAAPMGPIAPLDESDCPANSICYAPNASDIVGTMTTGTDTSDLKPIAANNQAGRQTTLMGDADAAITSNSTPTLVAPNYSRVGYGFAGWSPDFNATSSSTIYGPNQTITVATDGTGDADVSEHGLILYPVWMASTGSLQDSTKVATLCGTGAGSLTQATYNSTTGKMEATLSSMTALTDQRDGNAYTIAKLADGKCWMTENLRIEANDTIGDTNKNLSQGYGTSITYGNFTGLANSENANFSTTNPPVANSLYSTNGSTVNTIKGGNGSYYYARMPRYNNNNTNRFLTASYNGTGSGTYYHWHGYGNYYTWAAAMANIKQYNSPTSTDDEGKTSETANTSLCPSGWRLPYGRNTGNGNTTGGFYYLNAMMGNITDTQASKTWRSFPNNYVYPGLFGRTGANGRSTSGFYLSSTAYGDEFYYLGLGSMSITPGTISGGKYYGQSIRCVSDS